jgi:WD40 repeat protein
MTCIEHRLTRRDWSSTRVRGIALALLLGGLLLAGASKAAAYTFTPVPGSPFFAGGSAFGTGGHQVVFSPRGTYLVDASFNNVYVQTVSKKGVVGTPQYFAGPLACKLHKGLPINTGRIDSVAYSPNGALFAEVEEPGLGQPTGTLRIYRAHGKKLSKDSCRTLPYVTSFYHFGNNAPEPYYAVAFGPNGLLAVTNEGKSNVSVYSVTKAGKTHPVSGSPFATGKDPDAVAFGPTASGGEALATANWGANNVSAFTASGGVVAPAAGSPFVALAGPSSVAFSPTGGLLAVADSGAEEVNIYSVSLVGGLTGVAAAHTGGPPQSAAFSANGGLLATADSSNVSVFSVASTGQLAQVSGSPFSPPGAPVSIAFDANRTLLAVATGKTAVYAYR